MSGAHGTRQPAHGRVGAAQQRFSAGQNPIRNPWRRARLKRCGGNLRAKLVVISPRLAVPSSISRIECSSLLNLKYSNDTGSLMTQYCFRPYTWQNAWRSARRRSFWRGPSLPFLSPRSASTARSPGLVVDRLIGGDAGYCETQNLRELTWQLACRAVASRDDCQSRPRHALVHLPGRSPD